MDNPVVVPHQGQKPEWLEDDAIITCKDAAQIDGHRGRADDLNWRLPHPAFKYDRPSYFLPTNHWAAPVLRAGLTPWNPKLQGDGPPKDYAGGKVTLRNGQIKDGWGMSWSWAPNDQEYRFDPAFDIIGYEPTPSQPAFSAEDEQRYTQWLASAGDDVTLSREQLFKFQDRLNRQTPSQPASPPHESAGREASPEPPLSTPPTQAQGTEMKS